MKELSQLQYFRVVAKTEHMTLAAELLHLSQPNLSNAITRLEKALGVPLFDRKRGKISLNEYGRTYLTYVEQAFSALEKGEARLREMSALSNGKVSIACSLQNYYEGIIESFCLRFPTSVVGINHSLQDVNSIREQLLSGDLDFAVCTDLETTGIQWTPIIANPICALVSSRNPLAERGRIKLTDLRDELFICNNVGVNRSMTTKLCREYGFEPNVAFESNESILSGVWIEQNRGVSLSTAEDLRHYVLQRTRGDHPPIQALIITEPQSSVNLGLARARDGELSKEARELYDFTTEYMKTSNTELALFWEEYCAGH